MCCLWPVIGSRRVSVVYFRRVRHDHRPRRSCLLPLSLTKPHRPPPPPSHPIATLQSSLPQGQDLAPLLSANTHHYQRHKPITQLLFDPPRSHRLSFCAQDCHLLWRSATRLVFIESLPCFSSLHSPVWNFAGPDFTDKYVLVVDRGRVF